MSINNRPFNYQDEFELVTHLMNTLECRLAGRNETRVLRIIPSDHCHLGVLGPRAPYVEEPEPLDSIENNDNADEQGLSQLQKDSYARNDIEEKQKNNQNEDIGESTIGEAEQIAAEQQGYARDSIRRPPSSLGFEIVVTPDSISKTIELTLDVQFSIYTQHFPTFEEQQRELGRQENIANNSITSAHSQIISPRPIRRGTLSLLEVFVRRSVRIPPISIQIDPSKGKHRVTDNGIVQRALDAVINKAITDPTIWRTLIGTATVPAQALSNPEMFSQYLHTIATGPVLRPPLEAKLDIRIYPMSDRKVRIRCYLCNDTLRDVVQRFRDQHNILADCQVQGTLVSGTLAPVELLPIPRDYQFDLSVWAVGHGASAIVSDDRRIIRTESLARYFQPRRTTRLQPSAQFEDLIRDPFGTLEEIRHAMLDYAEDWQNRIIEQNELRLNADQLNQCHNDLLAFRNEESRFAAGIAALKKDNRLLQAFEGMNRAFQRISAGRYNSWHLFQIVFIVTQLTALAIREGITEGEWPQGINHNWENALDWVDVLWFPTGGGKTEAYLGLISCAALYDRLRGKNFGITAWLRFPLRMLSVQQLQRAVKVLWETEQERRRLFGSESRNSEPISLGYFVGKSSTPNQLNANNAGEWSFDNLERDQLRREKLLLVSNCPACQGVGTIRIQPDRVAERIRHICSNCGTELPVYVSDDEIYRFLPTVIVGTIDKMASIAYNPKFPMLWGGASWRCQEGTEHGYGMGDWCVSNCPANPRHGARARRRTAIRPYDPTPSLHIQDELHLLQQELGAFAGHYETLVRSCEISVGGRPPKTIAATATIEGFEHQIRHIYGVPYARRFPTRGYNLYETFYTTADRDYTGSDQPIKNARVYVAFRPPHLHAADAAALCVRILQEELIRLYENPSEATTWLPNAKAEEEVRELLYYYSTLLTYVGSKARGIRIRQTLDREASVLRPGNSRDLNTEFLSGDSTLATIAETIRRIEHPPEWMEDNYLDVTIATNVISHGVDVERFNLMVMDSIPEETADYIQASSRSGRKHFGFVLTVLAPYSLRASSIYHRFTEYHKHLERLVSPVSVNRFAKYAAMRTSPGVFMGILLGRYGPIAHTTEFVQRNLAAEFLTPSMASNLTLRVSSEELYQALESAYALGQGIYPEGLELAMRQELRDYVQHFLHLIRGSHQKWTREAVQPKPMSSLRDVDLGVRFRPEEDANWQELQWFSNS
jgi:hypothetical protein